MTELIKLNEYPVRNVLKTLLSDMTTDRRIIPCADGEEALCGVLPRAFRPSAEQDERTRRNGEVSTPAWIVNKMINYLDEDWFGRDGAFNTVYCQGWMTSREPVAFPDGKSWRDYVDSRRLEITCGEAPYIASRYNSTTGEIIPLRERIGLLDRKLRVVKENASDDREWVEWSLRALQSVYGYEFLGDNLLIARINVLNTYCDYFTERFGREVDDELLERAAGIISRNLWLMDGLSDSVPGQDEDCKIFDWRSGRTLCFKDIDLRSSAAFDYVVGNPPYQEETTRISLTNGQLRRKSIFHFFQLQADETAVSASCLIYPGGRWIQQSGKGMKQFGSRQINDHRLSLLVFYPHTRDIFAKADIADGVTIVLKRQGKTEPGFDYCYIAGGLERCVRVDNPGSEILPLDPRDIAVVRKITELTRRYGLKVLHDRIMIQKLFGIESDFVEKNPGKVRLMTDGCTLAPEEIKLFTNDRAGKAGRAKWFIADRSVIPINRQYIYEWQVVVSSANAGGQKRDNQLEIVDDRSAFGRSRVALGSFATREEAQNFYNYCKTYVIRYAFLMTDEALTTLALNVPDLGSYTDPGIVDFTKDLDAQLFELCGFTGEEISYIKNRIDNLRSKPV